MEKYIEDIIEIILEDVSCDHQVGLDGAGKIYDDVTYCLKNEKEVIEKCIKAIPGKKPEITEGFIMNQAKIFQGLAETNAPLKIYKDFVAGMIKEIERRSE